MHFCLSSFTWDNGNSNFDLFFEPYFCDLDLPLTHCKTRRKKLDFFFSQDKSKEIRFSRHYSLSSKRSFSSLL
jgi:hypothetical protein